MQSLRDRLFLVLITTILMVASILLFSTLRTSYAHSHRQLVERFERAENLFIGQMMREVEGLKLAMDTYAKDFSTKKAIASGASDQKTLLSVLYNHQTRTNADFSMVTLSSGEIIAETLELSNTPLFSEKLASTFQLLAANDKAYLVSRVPVKYVENSNGVDAWLTMGVDLQKFLDNTIRDLTGLNITIFEGNSLVASNRKGSQLTFNPAQLQSEKSSQGHVPENPMEVSKNGVDFYDYVFTPDANNAEIRVFFTIQKNDAFVDYHALVVNLLVPLVVMCILAILASRSMANKLTQPITALVKVAENITLGNYNNPIPPVTSLEVKTLAGALENAQTAINDRETSIEAHVASLRARQEQLLKTQESERKASQAKSSFLSMMSHELRTPLNAVLINLDLLQSEEETDEAKQEGFTLSREAINHLLSLLTNILNFTKDEIETQPTKLEPCCIKHEVQVMADLFTQQIVADDSHENFAVTYDVPSDFPDTLSIDRDKYHQILNNLLSNAVKFTQKGRINVSVRIAEQEPNSTHPLMLVTQVDDTGVGIEKEHQEQIFVPFQQIEAKLNRSYDGIGMGLAMCHRLCYVQGGMICLVNKTSQGSCFEFSIPAKLSKVLVEEASPELPDKSVLKQVDVLVVEDNIVNEKLLVKILKKMGFEKIRVARNGQEGVDAVLDVAPQLVLMDIQMPILDGKQATQQIRTKLAKDLQPVIIAVTANAVAGERESCLEHGVDDFMTKPISIKIIKEKLAPWVVKITA